MNRVDLSRRAIRLLAACALAVIAWARVCAAQDAGTSNNPPPAKGEVQVTLSRFGVGDMARPGDWAGVRLRLVDSAAQQRALVVRIRGYDSDGDTPVYQRDVTTNPGVAQDLWLYPYLSFHFGSTSRLNVTVFEASQDQAEGLPRTGRLVGQADLSPGASRVLRPTDGLIGIVGTLNRSLGLSAYFGGAEATGDAWLPRGHEPEKSAEGILPAELPDRWMGLAPMSVLIWADGDPADLRADKASAVRDWVQRGGHLVIVLPPVGQNWLTPSSNELYSIMPVVTVARNESAEMSLVAPLLTRRESVLLPRTGVLHTFKPAQGAQPAEAMPVLATTEGDCVVVRRLVGAGAVTLIGIDLNQTSLSQGNLIDADAFWHRVLGRRGQTTLTEGDRKSPMSGVNRNRMPVEYDSVILKWINRSGNVATGVLAAFVLFVFYWLLAGPIGFAVLKKRGMQRHSWAAFVAAAGVFTAIAWGGASAMRPHAVDATHVTILDHVYGQPFQRAKMWASVLIPDYGTANIAVGERGDDESRSPSALAAWEPWGADPVISGFPDARSYLIDTRVPDRFTCPTRSTVKQIEAEWAGGPVWKMPLPVGEPGEAGVTFNPISGPDQPLLKGILRHSLPGTLNNVTLLVVRRQVPISAQSKTITHAASGLICQGYAFSVSAWPPDEDLTLELATRLRPAAGTSDAGVQFMDSFLLRYVPQLPAYDFGSPEQIDPSRAPDRFRALAFFPMLPPPDSSSMQNAYAAQRTSTHGLDLAMWFTQPCLIIMGELDDAPTPIPLKVDGKDVPSRGKTLVRWVYPLPPDPPAYLKQETSSDADGAGAGRGSDADKGGG